MYIYEYHLGGIYITSAELSEDKLHCELCDDDDRLLGKYDCVKDALIGLADRIDFFGTDGYQFEYIFNRVKSFNDCPSKYEAILLIMDTQKNNKVRDSI